MAVVAKKLTLNGIVDTKKEGEDAHTLKNLRQRITRTNGVTSEIFLSKATLDPSCINDSVIGAIIKIIAEQRNCTSVILRNNAIQAPKHQMAILQAICQNPNLTNLQLYGINNVSVTVLNEIVKLALVCLTLFNSLQSQTSELEASTMALLNRCKTLKSLVVVGTTISDVALDFLTQFPLHQIVLDKVRISAQGVQRLSGMPLRSLSISLDSNGVQFNTVEVKGIQDTLLQSKTLESVQFIRPKICSGSSFAPLLWEACEKNRRSNLSSSKISYFIEQGLQVVQPFVHCHPEAAAAYTATMGLSYDRKEDSELRKFAAEYGCSPNDFVGNGGYAGFAGLTDDDDCVRNTFLNRMIAGEGDNTAKTLQLLSVFKDMINVREYDWEWKTLLIVSAKVYSADVIFLKILELFGSYVDVDARDKDGRTALHYLCAYGKKDLIEKLLKYNPDIDAQDFQGKTPLDYSEMSQLEVEQILDSINIAPTRDAYARMNHVFSHLGHLGQVSSGFSGTYPKGTEANPTDPLTTLANFDKLVPPSSDDEHVKQFHRQRDAIRKLFAGQSVIERCMDQKKATAEYLVVRRAKRNPISKSLTEVTPLAGRPADIILSFMYHPLRSLNGFYETAPPMSVGEKAKNSVFF